MKKCFKCGEEKPIDEFYRHSGKSDGRMGKCKGCTKNDVRINYRKNIDHYRNYDKDRAMRPDRVAMRSEYQKTEQGKESVRKSKEKWDIKNPKKKWCATSIGNAVRDKKITKPTLCSKCSKKPKRLHGHHDDYDRPLDVRWLCPACHISWHRENGEGLNA